MITSRMIRNAMGAAPTSSQLLAEVKEMLAEVLALNLAGIIDEGSDCCWFVFAIWQEQTGISLPAVGAGRCWLKFLSRRKVWEEIFGQYGLAYHPRYTSGGTNYNRPEKVARALELARQEQA